MDLKKHLSVTKGGESLKKSFPFAEMISLEGNDLSELWIENEIPADSLKSIMLNKVRHDTFSSNLEAQ